MSRKSRLRHTQKKKQARPGPRPALGSGKLLRRMSRKRVDVLQNIEFAIVREARHDPDVDDRVIFDALEAVLRDTPPEYPRAARILVSLTGMRDLRDSLPAPEGQTSDKVWRDGIRTVRDSVRRHSSLRPGARGYLNFVSAFVA